MKPREEAHTIGDRDALRACVAPSGTVSLWCDTRIGKRRETLTLGRCNSAAPARTPRSLDALWHDMGLSPLHAMAGKKVAETDALAVCKWVERHFECRGDPNGNGEQLADRPLAMRRSTCSSATGTVDSA